MHLMVNHIIISHMYCTINCKTSEYGYLTSLMKNYTRTNKQHNINNLVTIINYQETLIKEQTKVVVHY